MRLIPRPSLDVATGARVNGLSSSSPKHLYMDNSAEVLHAIQLLETAVSKATVSLQDGAAQGHESGVQLLQAEVRRLERELEHYRRVYAAELAGHLRC